jgi:hypothetical protein
MIANTWEEIQCIRKCWGIMDFIIKQHNTNQRQETLRNTKTKIVRWTVKHRSCPKGLSIYNTRQTETEHTEKKRHERKHDKEHRKHRCSAITSLSCTQPISKWVQLIRLNKETKSHSAGFWRVLILWVTLHFNYLHSTMLSQPALFSLLMLCTVISVPHTLYGQLRFQWHSVSLYRTQDTPTKVHSWQPTGLDTKQCRVTRDHNVLSLPWTQDVTKFRNKYIFITVVYRLLTEGISALM